MKRVLKWGLVTVGTLVAVLAAGAGIYVGVEVSAFDASLNKIYDIPAVSVSVSQDAPVLARGRHLVMAVGACTSSACHGSDLGGGKPIAMGPVGTFVGPNITSRGILAVYTDSELVRLIRDGVKKDGRSLRFMPVDDFNWLPDNDMIAMVSYLRTVPGLDRESGATVIGVLGKVLDRNDVFPIDVARRIDPSRAEHPPAPAPSPEYGSFLVRLCKGCHGAHLSGGKIPGAPASVPIPTNLTPDASGLAGWAYDDFDRVLVEGLRRNGRRLDPFMPIESWSQLDQTEKRALWAYLQSVPARPLGGR